MAGSERTPEFSRLELEVTKVKVRDRLVALGYPPGRYFLWRFGQPHEYTVWAPDKTHSLVNLGFDLPLGACQVEL